jgi:hypothetical protein
MPQRRVETCEEIGAELTISHVEYEQVQALAYLLWLQRGSPIGSPQEDWFQAENQLRAMQSARMAA